jgi:hypothetical protein
MKLLLAAMIAASTVWAQSAEGPAKTVPQQGPPPKHLTVRSDGHVSANEDAVGADNFEIHVVRPGETLSQIAAEVLKNPRLWPQLWEQNEHIINPHWIYPNDKILIKPVTTLADAKPPEPEAPAPERPQQRTATAPAPQVQNPPQPALVVEAQKPVSEFKFNDLYCSGFVQAAPVAKDLKVISRFDPSGSALATEADYVYLSQGSQDGIAPGSLYQVVRPTRIMTNPRGRTKAERDLGMHYLDVAQLRVVLVQPDFSLARIVHSCADAVEVGDILMPFQQIDVAAPSRPRTFSPTMATDSGITGIIVATKDVMLNFGSVFKGTRQIPGVHGDRLGNVDRGIASEGAIVYIDAGEERSVRPGDVFIVYRNVELDRRLYNVPKEASKLQNARRAVGELIVVKVGERAATAVVSYASDGLVLGDAVERR